MSRPGGPQRLFALILRVGTGVGLAVLVAGFVVYVSGLRPVLLPISDLPRYWGLPASRYLEAVGLRPGWGWLARAGHGDVLNLVGLALLGTVTIVCYLAVVPPFVRRGDRAYGLMALVEALILLLAASGLFVAGH